jgi:hypothetical protein
VREALFIRALFFSPSLYLSPHRIENSRQASHVNFPSLRLHLSSALKSHVYTAAVWPYDST